MPLAAATDARRQLEIASEKLEANPEDLEITANGSGFEMSVKIQLKTLPFGVAGGNRLSAGDLRLEKHPP
jgi:hypothetical protein